jgi:hypothetical protein
MLPIAWVLGCVLAYGSAFYSIPWPYVDVYRSISDATALGWRDTIAMAFAPEIEYRPFFTLAVRAAYDLVGLRLFWYQTLVLAQFAAVLALLVWLMRPIGSGRAVAATVALSCVVGLHTSRILFGFWPLNFGSFVLGLLLLATALALDSRPRPWVCFWLALIALFSLEWGAALLVLLPALWLARAPGADRRAVLGAFAAAAVYAAARLLFDSRDPVPLFYTESGFGFSQLDPAALHERFGDAPWLFWLYNVASTLLTVAASEPRSGVFAFTAAILEGNVPYWRWLHVSSSLVTTTVMVATLLACRPAGRDRLLLVAGLVLLVVGSGFGAIYTRDRLGLVPGIGYGLLLYLTVVLLVDRLPSSGWRRRLAAAGIVLVGALWCVRSVEAYFQLRDTAWDFRREWQERSAELDQAPGPDRVLAGLRRAASRASPDDPRQDPTWSQVAFERRFPTAASWPLSPPFDIRWGPQVTVADRRSLEAGLGLVNGELVERDPRRRTWNYRLRRPTRARIRSLLDNPAVEDTGGIDVERLDVPQ